LRHYDSIVGTGTNDNGSGVVTILEIARLLQKNIPTEYSIKFKLSGEEDGLKGSQILFRQCNTQQRLKWTFRLVFYYGRNCMLLEQLIIPLLAKESYKYTLHLIMLHH
jgi:Zn-dependent M28 family amino/carboxypeptidase